MTSPIPALTRTALLLIDVQRGFDDPQWGTRNNPEAETNIARLLRVWRAHNGPIVHIQHHSTEPDSPLRPGQPGVELKAEAHPKGDEPLFQKRVNSAFTGTDLEAHLETNGIDTVVIVGLTTNHCVSTTARVAENLGYGVVVVDDATAAFDHVDHPGRYFDAETLHAAALANLHEEFAAIKNTEAVIARWKRGAGTTAESRT